LAEATLEEVQQENLYLQEDLALLKESMADVVLRMEDLGWQKLMGTMDDADAIGLGTVKNTSKTCRSLAILNPIIVRGINVRTAYIWGNGVEFGPKESGKAKKLSEAAAPAKKLGTAEQGFLDQPSVKKWLASDQAWQEMEKATSTDGNFFMLVSKNTVTPRGRRKARHDVARVPMDQITGAVTDQDNVESIWFYRREWTRLNPNGSGGERMVQYYPAIDYDEGLYGTPGDIDGIKVDYDSRIAHRTVNKQTGWKWGVPTLWPVMFWAKAHKEYLETQLALAKAYARFAFKATAPTANAAKAAAAKVAAAPGTDPYTGMPNQVGGAFFGAGINLQAVGKPGGAVDFEGGNSLAEYVAAGLSVPISDLLANSGHGNRSSTETIFESNAKVMEAEQAANKAFFEAIFDFLGLDIKVEFPPINKELTYRQIQAIAQAASLHVLSDEEIRELVVAAFEDEDMDPDALPDVMDLKLQLIAQELAARAGGLVTDLPNQSANSPQGGGAPSAAPGGKGTNAKPQTANPSYGDNGYRNDAGQHKYAPNNG
jgi:hypothetical protein